MELLPNFQTYKSYTLAVITNNSPQATYIYTKTALSSSLEQKLNFVIYKSPAHHLTINVCIQKSFLLCNQQIFHGIWK